MIFYLKIVIFDIYLRPYLEVLEPFALPLPVEVATATAVEPLSPWWLERAHNLSRVALESWTLLNWKNEKYSLSFLDSEWMTKFCEKGNNLMILLRTDSDRSGQTQE